MSEFTSLELANLLARKGELTRADQLDLIRFLTDSTKAWEALLHMHPQPKPWEPDAAADPVIRAFRRAVHPRVNLTLVSSHLRASRLELPDLRFAELVFEEVLRMTRRNPARCREFVKAPRGVLDQLAEEWPPEFVRSLGIRLDSGIVQIHADQSESIHAQAYMGLVRRRVTQDMTSEDHVHLERAKFHLKYLNSPILAADHSRAALKHIGSSDPLLSFELAAESMVKTAGSRITEADVFWVLGFLADEDLEENDRLAGFFQKARFVSGLPTGFEKIAADVSGEVIKELPSVDHLGCQYSQARFRQTLGKLTESSDPEMAAGLYVQALGLFGELRMADAYEEVLRALFCISGLDTRGLSQYLEPALQQAIDLFGKQVARRMRHAVTGELSSAHTLFKFVRHEPFVRWFERFGTSVN